MLIHSRPAHPVLEVAVPNPRRVGTHVPAALLVLFLAACQTTPKPHWPIPGDAQIAAVNGYPMTYSEKGAGAAVLLVHGAINDYRYWALQLDELPARFRVISVSLRHYYPERWSGDGQFSLTHHAADLIAFIERLGQPVFLVGHSRGGPVALEVAHRRPDLVRKLVLADPALFSLLPGAASASDDPRVKRAKATHEFFKRGDIEGGLQFFFDDANAPGAWVKLPEAQRQIRRDNAWTIVGQLADEERVSCEDMKRLKLPVLLIGGEQSPPLFKKALAAAQSCVPNAVTIVVPKAGHQMNQHNPEAFNAAVEKFFVR